MLYSISAEVIFGFYKFKDRVVSSGIMVVFIRVSFYRGSTCILGLYV